MQTLIDTLHQGGYSCVVRNHGETRTFRQRGVADLWSLCQDNENFLNGALIADKVVGKGAAALMVYGGICEVHADVISSPALALLEANGIRVTFRTKTGPHRKPERRRTMPCRKPVHRPSVSGKDV